MMPTMIGLIGIQVTAAPPRTSSALTTAPEIESRNSSSSLITVIKEVEVFKSDTLILAIGIF